MTARLAPGAWMLREIREQPDVLARIYERELPVLAALGARLRRRPPPLVVLAARGTSDNAALYGRYLIETRLQVPVSLAAPSVVTVYGGRLRLRGAVVIGLSQSGRSPDVVEFVRVARSAGAATVAVTNDPRSPLARGAQEVVCLQAGPERSIAATKTYTAQLMCLSLLVAHAAGDRALLRAHGRLPELAAQALAAEPAVEEVAGGLARVGECIVTSRGYNFATAQEAALKLTEGARLVAEALSSADLLHGPIAVVGRGFPVLVVAPPGRVARHLADVLHRLRARGARTVVASSASDLLAMGTQAIPLPVVDHEELTPHVYILPLQLLAYHVARRRGLDPDRPRGLRKVTPVL
jgi:glucosamine--fructose-6-phosphate aminotransferase (isomerizing)